MCEGGISKGGALQALCGRIRLSSDRAKRDPIGAVLHFAKEQRGRAVPEEVWFSTNHEQDGFQTCLRVVTLRDVDDLGKELAAMGPVRRTPASAEMGAADVLLNRLVIYIQWDWSGAPGPHPLQYGHQRSS